MYITCLHGDGYIRTLFVHTERPLCVVYPQEVEEGIKILAVMDSSPPYEITLLKNHSLPTVGCQPNYSQCDLRCFRCGDSSSGEWCCMLPVLSSAGRNGLAIIQLFWSDTERNSTSGVLQLKNQTIITHNEDCVIAHSFDRQLGGYFVSCINTTDQAYLLFMDISNSDDAPELMSRQYTIFSKFPGSLSLSEPRYVQASYNRDCQYPDNVFFVASSQGYTTNVLDENIIIAASWNISDCWYPTDISYIEGSLLLLRVQCSQYITKLVIACGLHRTVETYDSRVNGTMYQCGVPGTDVRVNLTLGNELISFMTTEEHPLFENMSRSHPFHLTREIAYGFCLVGSDLTFVFGLNNGSVFSHSFTSGNLSCVAQDSCDGTTGNYTRGECYKTRPVSSSPDLVVAYDHSTSNFIVANLSCPTHPVVGQIQVEPRPPLAGFVGGFGGTCASHTPPPVMTSESTVSPTHTTDTAGNVTVLPTSTLDQNLAVTPEPKVEPQQWYIIGAPLLTAFIAAIIIFTVLVICGYYWRKRKKSSANSNANIPLLTRGGSNYNASEGTSSHSNETAFAKLPDGEDDTPSPQPPSEQNSDSKTSDSSSVADEDAPRNNVGEAVAPQSVNPGLLEPVDVGPADSPRTPPSPLQPFSEHSHCSQGVPPSPPQTHLHPDDTPSSLAQTSYEHSHPNGEALGSGSDSAGNRSTCQERVSEGATAPDSIPTPCDSDDEQPKPKPVQQATPGRESEPLSSAGRDEPISRSLEQLVIQDDSAPLENGFQPEGSLSSLDSYEPRPKPVSSRPDSLHWAPREAPGPRSRNPGALSSPPAHHFSGSPPPVGVGALHSPSQDPSPAAAAAFYGEESQHVTPQASSSNAGNAETVMGYFPLRLPHQQQQPPSEKDPQTGQPKREQT